MSYVKGAPENALPVTETDLTLRCPLKCVAVILVTGHPPPTNGQV